MYQKKNSILVYAFEQAAYHAVNMTFFTPTSVHIIAEDFFLPGALKGFQWIFLTWYLLNWHDSYMRIVAMILKGIVKELPLFHCQKVCYQNGKGLSSFPVS